jgi:hypothetical protein
MEINLPTNITIVENRTRSIKPLIQCAVIIEIRENIMFTPTRFPNEFCQFHLQLFNRFLLIHHGDRKRQYKTMMKNVAYWSFGINKNHQNKIIAAEGVSCEEGRLVAIQVMTKRKKIERGSRRNCSRELYM